MIGFEPEMAQKILLTPNGLESLKKELEKLENFKRPQVVARLERARDMGDLTENSDYYDAKDELGLLEGRILELKEIIDRAEVVNKSKNCKKVALGCQVKVQNNQEEHLFRIVGEWEADPIQKKISYTSPLGQALIGRRVGEEIEFEAPVGKIVYKILSID